MKKDLIELVFILDESGSMYSLTDDTIGGFNSMINDQKKVEGDCLVTTVLFNSDYKTVHDRVSLKEIKDMTRDDYKPNSCTALIDALGDTINKVETIHKYIREEDIPETVLFVITTDGMENASHKYTSDDIKAKIEEKKKLGWEFMFLAANIDAVSTGRMYGIDEENSFSFEATDKGVKKSYCMMSASIEHSRKRKK